jgi:hypothetical protein
MADISDVENAMVGIIADSLGLGTAYIPGSTVLSPAAQCRCSVFRGWPLPADITTKIQAGVSTVSVFPVPGSSRRTTRYAPKWNPGPSITPTLTVAVSGRTITFGGLSSANQVAGIQFGGSVTCAAYAYRPTTNDTPSTIAAAFAALIPASSSNGASLTLPTDVGISATVASDQTVWIETRRQEQNVWVITWCPTPSARDVVTSLVDGGFANLLDGFGRFTDQFPLPDGSSGRLLYISSHTDDQAQRAGIWRRDLRYVVSYPTTLVQTFPTVVFPGGSLSGGVSDFQAVSNFGEIFQSGTIETDAAGNPLEDAAGNLVGI